MTRDGGNTCYVRGKFWVTGKRSWVNPFPHVKKTDFKLVILDDFDSVINIFSLSYILRFNLINIRIIEIY